MIQCSHGLCRPHPVRASVAAGSRRADYIRNPVRPPHPQVAAQRGQECPTMLVPNGHSNLVHRHLSLLKQPHGVIQLHAPGERKRRQPIDCRNTLER